MSLDEQVSATAGAAETVAESTSSATALDTEAVQRERSEKLLQAKELYSHGSRNFLIKNFAEAADELSRVCALYAELYGEVADELGMPYLFYAKSLIALSLDENKVIDVPDEAADDDDDDDEDEEEDAGEQSTVAAVPDTNGAAGSESEAVATNENGTNIKAQSTKLSKIKEDIEEKKEADSTADNADKAQPSSAAAADVAVKEGEDAQVSSTADNKPDAEKENKAPTSSTTAVVAAAAAAVVLDDEKPSTSNGKVHADTEDTNASDEEDNEAATNLQLAWEILETAAKIFARQGVSGLPNLAEVQTELGNIQFENCILDAAREDYEKALKIYQELENQSYRRAKAEIYYKIGLTYLMQQMNKEGASALKDACQLIQGEIDDIKAKNELSEKETNTIQDLEETKQEIEAKIAEIEEMQAQQIADVRAALDSYIKPIMSKSADDAAGPSSSSSAASTSNAASSSAAQSKPNDISHLIKRKKPEEPTSEAEAASPAKRPAL